MTSPASYGHDPYTNHVEISQKLVDSKDRPEADGQTDGRGVCVFRSRKVLKRQFNSLEFVYDAIKT